MTVSVSVIGAPVPITGTFIDNSGSVIAPGTVYVNVTDPAGSTTQLTASPVGDGSFRYVYTPSLTGIFTYWLSGLSPVAVQLPDVFTVVPAASSAIISLADARAQLSKSSTVTDFELRGFILAASEMITRLCGPTNALAPVTERVDPGGGGKLVLANAPIVSVATVTPTAGWSPGALDSSTYTVYAEAGLISMADGTWFTYPQTVVYTPGRSVVPSSLQEAAGLIVQQMWDTKRGGAISGGNSSGGMAGFGGESDAPIEVDGMLLPARAAELLQPYRLPPGVR
jgi:hypothetical protein